MYRLLITTLNIGIPTGSVVERFETMQEMQAAERALDRANERWRKSEHYRSGHDLYWYSELN